VRMNMLKRALNAVLSPMHLELHRRGTESYWLNCIDQLHKEINALHQLDFTRDLWLRQLSLRTVIDVGANTGQFSRHIRQVLPDVAIYAFEPLPDCFEALKASFSGDSLVTVFDIGLGDSVGAQTFERNQFSPSSSFLKVTKAHTDPFPYTANTSFVTVQVNRLDEVMKSQVVKPPLLFKIDAQGFEERVLRGGEETARMSAVILVETSFVELYEQQPLFDDIYVLLKNWGFTYEGPFDQLRDPRTGKILQEDSVFTRC
jgi:FkbM family methyltransferase